MEGRVADFCDWAEKRPERRDATARRGGARALPRALTRALRVAQVTLSFFEKRQKQAWFSTSEERMIWEQWCAAAPPVLHARLGPSARVHACDGCDFWLCT